MSVEVAIHKMNVSLPREREIEREVIYSEWILSEFRHVLYVKEPETSLRVGCSPVDSAPAAQGTEPTVQPQYLLAREVGAVLIELELLL